MATKAQLDVDARVKGAEEVEDLADALDEVDESSQKAAKGLDDLNQIGSKLSSLGGNLTSIGATLTAGITVPIVGLSIAALKLGADAIETDNLVEQSFGSMTQAATDWSANLSKTLGLNKFELREQSASFNLLALNMGESKEEAFATATGITELAADLDSLLNLTQKGIDPIQALQSGLVGNSEALRSLNIFVNDATLRQIAFETGITETNRQLSQQEKFQATLEAITRQTTAAVGDLARTMDSPINQMKIFGERIVQAATDLGITLIPIFQKVAPVVESFVSTIEEVVEWFGNLDESSQTTVVVIGAIAAAIPPLILGLGVIISFAGSVVTALGALGVTTAGIGVAFGALSTALAAILPILAAVATGVLLGGAIGIAIANFLEWAGVIDSVSVKVARLVEEMKPSEQQTKLMGEASEEAGRKVTDWGEATSIMNEKIQKMQAASESAAVETVALGTAAEDTGESSEELSARLEALAAAQKKAEAAAVAHEKKITSLADKLGGAGLEKDADDATEAIQRLGGAANLSVSGIESLDSLIVRLRKDSKELTPELKAVALELSRIAVFEGLDDLNFEAPIISAEDMNDALADMDGEFSDLNSGVPPIIANIDEKLGGLKDPVFDFNDAMDGVNDILSEARGFMNLFGIEADSAFGKIVGKATELFDTFNSILGLGDKLLGLFGSKGGLSGILGGLFGGGGGAPGGGVTGLATKALGLGGAAAATGVGGGAAAAGGGAAAAGGGGISAAISGGASSVIGGISTVLAAIPVAGWIALAGIGVGFLVKSIFGGPSDFERAGEELGFAVGEGVQHGIVNLFESRGGTLGEAITLSMGEVIKGAVAEGTADFDVLSEMVADTFSVIEQGGISSAEGMAALTASVAQLVPQLGEMGEVGRDQMERLLRASFDTGQSFEGIDAAVAGMADRLLNDATAGGETFLNTINSLGVSGRESLEFLRNAFGETLPEGVLIAINEVLGLNQAITDTQGATAGVSEEMARLPEVAATSVEGIAGAFAAGSEEITSGLDPIAEKMATEITAAGDTTALAINESFNSTNEAIKAGLGEVSSTFVSQVAPAALAAAAATDQITKAANAAANAAAKIKFPSGPSGGGTGAGAQSGFSGRVLGPATFNVEPGVIEDVSFVRPGSGVGSAKKGVEVNMGDTHITIGSGGSNVRQLVDALEKNNEDQAERLKRILGSQG